MMRLGSVLFGAFLTVLSALPVAADELEAVFSRFLSDNAMPGGVLLIDRPGPADTAIALGYADLARKIPMTVNHRFYVGSITKTMTSVVILQLASEKWIKLSDPINRFLDPAIAARIANSRQARLRHLLNQSAGIPDYLDGNDFFHNVGLSPQHGWRNADVLQLIYDKPAVHQPGTRFNNSNSHYVLLGLVIEKLEGPGLERSFQQRIFDPLGMHDTHFGRFPRPKMLARGYDDPRDTGNYEDVSEFDVGDRLADGGVVSTAADLARFLNGLFSNPRLLGENALKRMTIEDAMFIEGVMHGYGITSQRTDDHGTALAYDGTYFGYEVEMTYFPKYDTSIIMMANARRIRTATLTALIDSLVFGGEG